jgi:energy-converting hydrogenase Eha subunit F
MTIKFITAKLAKSWNNLENIAIFLISSLLTQHLSIVFLLLLWTMEVHKFDKLFPN